MKGEDKKKPISQVSWELAETGRQLRGIDEQKIHCLKQYLECKPLVQWLKTELKGDLLFNFPS